MKLDATVVLPRNMPVSPTPEWFSRAVKDPAMLAATLVLSAGHYAAHYGHVGEPLLINCRGYAMNQINKRMSDSVLAINNGTVAAVTCLALHEVDMRPRL